MIVQRNANRLGNGRIQVVSISLEHKLLSMDAVVRNAGERLIVAPVPSQSLIDLLKSVEPLDEDFDPIEDLVL